MVGKGPLIPWSGCERISPDPLGLRGHTANWAKFNTYISYFGARTRSRATEVGYFFFFFFPWKGSGGI